jgi:hypothetical protein
MSLLSQIEKWVHSTTTTEPLKLRDVLEIQEYLTKTYIEQTLQQQLQNNDDSEGNGDGEGGLSVEADKDGDYIDKDGFVYDISSNERIGHKDPQSGEKTWFKKV